jgi:hypothetical protein
MDENRDQPTHAKNGRENQSILWRSARDIIAGMMEDFVAALKAEGVPHEAIHRAIARMLTDED